MDDFFESGLFEDFGAVEVTEFEESRVADVFENAAYYERSNAYWMQVPLPEEIAPSFSNPLASLDDETLLTMSPALIVHVQRTAAMGGMQVISPRAISLSNMAARTTHDRRTTDMFLVGSNANKNLDWPVLSDPVPPELFGFDPIDAYPSEIAPRPKVLSSGIVSASAGVSDPITKAFLIGRAVVDLQRRPDVAGSGQALSALIASAWGITEDEFEDMAEASLAPVGDLLRYAIRADESYPVINAPIQARKCISVGANTSGRAQYGEHAALDWRRMRVLAESVFYQSSRTEGYNLLQMAATSPPGDPRAPPDRAGILQMRPMPGAVWSHAPKTFRIDVAGGSSVRLAVSLPERVRAAVTEFYAVARPMAVAGELGVAMSLVPSTVREAYTSSREALIAGYKQLIGVASSHGARGRTSSAAVRDFVYQCLSENAKLHAIRAVWMVRFLHETARDFGILDLLDHTTTRHVAARMSDFIADMRIRLSVEANRRGATLEEWWDDMRALLPRELAQMSEGSGTWALAVAHFMLKPPTPKWSNLTRAMAHASHASLASMHVKDLRLPAVIGSPERVFTATDAAVRQLGMSYGAFYSAMYDVASILSGQMKRSGNELASRKLVAAGMMWDIRAKVASTISLHKTDGTSTTAGTLFGKHGNYHFTVAPYTAYTRWHAVIQSGGFVTVAVRRSFPHHVEGPVSSAFLDQDQPLFGANGHDGARLFRYAMRPSRLAADIEKTLIEIRHDAQAMITHYDNEDSPIDFERAPPVQSQGIKLDMSRYVPREGTYWATLALLDPTDAVALEDTLSAQPQEVYDAVTSNMYVSPNELLKTAYGIIDEASVERVVATEAVR